MDSDDDDDDDAAENDDDDDDGQLFEKRSRSLGIVPRNCVFFFPPFSKSSRSRSW